MNPQVLCGLQFTLSLVIFALIANWYVAPALRRLPIQAALMPLFLVHAFRYLPSTAFAPGQVDPTLPMDAMAKIAYGDLASAVLALIAVLFLRYRWVGALAIAWLVNIVASLDWLHASYLAAANHLVTYGLGGNWYIINYYVPLIGVVHVLIFARLIAERRTELFTPVRSEAVRPTV